MTSILKCISCEASDKDPDEGCIHSLGAEITPCDKSPSKMQLWWQVYNISWRVKNSSQVESLQHLSDRKSVV